MTTASLPVKSKSSAGGLALRSWSLLKLASHNVASFPHRFSPRQRVGEIRVESGTSQLWAAFPRLAGQHSDYVVKQLRVFQRTEGRPDGPAMKAVAHGLTADDMANAASFVQSM